MLIMFDFVTLTTQEPDVKSLGTITMTPIVDHVIRFAISAQDQTLLNVFRVLEMQIGTRLVVVCETSIGMVKIVPSGITQDLVIINVTSVSVPILLTESDENHKLLGTKSINVNACHIGPAQTVLSRPIAEAVTLNA